MCDMHGLCNYTNSYALRYVAQPSLHVFAVTGTKRRSVSKQKSRKRISYLTSLGAVGHLFCSDCLTTALQTEVQRHKCPMCRQKIESKPRQSYTTKTKGFWPLELKLMTATKKGKKADG